MRGMKTKRKMAVIVREIEYQKPKLETNDEVDAV